MASTSASSTLARDERSVVAPASLGRPSWALGAGVVSGIIVLQAATDLVAGRERARVIARLAFLAFELPILMLALSAAFG
jgi:hypothetical protein